jgi:hypothetical protein
VAKGSAKVGGGEEGQRSWRRLSEVAKVGGGEEGQRSWRRLSEVAKVVGGGEGSKGLRRWRRSQDKSVSPENCHSGQKVHRYVCSLCESQQ